VIKLRKIKWAVHVARTDEIINAYGIIVGKPKGKRLFGRPRRSWEDNIRTDLREIGQECVDWIHLDQERDQLQALVNTVMNLRVS
jgi:hypothetical protein